MKIYIETLGCPKNYNDSEVAAGLLAKGGHVLVDSPDDADVIMVNTCGFINDAKKESIDKILEMSNYKESGKKLIVSGCLSQRYSEELFKEMPEVDLFLGVNDYEKLPQLINDLDKRKLIANPCKEQILKKQERKYGDSVYSATLKIAEGCDNVCAYCIIPKIRGGFRSKSIEDIIEEARGLAAAGCKELILIAQDVTYYGMDLYGKLELPRLLRKLCKVDGIEWIRLMYCYEDRITDELIDTIAEEEKICNYLDIPIQHSSDRVLERMNRRSTGNSIDETIKRLKNRIPDIHIRTTLIVGFPGEKEEDFDNLIDFVESHKFARLGVFAYSMEEGTTAAEMSDQIDESVKLQRLDAIMRRQIDISLKLNREKIGKTLQVLVDEASEDGSYIGRSRFDAPEIDNTVIFTSERLLNPGDMVNVLIEDAFDYDLTGMEV